MLALAEVLTGIGVEVVRFNFPYRKKGSKRPDPMPVLKASIAQVVAGRKVIIGGRSMGGRAASMLAADHWLQGADHSLKGAAVLAEIGETTRRWTSGLTT